MGTPKARMDPEAIHRRCVLKALAGGAFLGLGARGAGTVWAKPRQDEPGAGSGTGPEAPAAPGEPPPAVLERCRAIGIEEPTVERTERYLGIGDAPEDYLSEALSLCEALADDYMGHFRERGFELAEPAEPLVMVGLNGREGFREFLELQEAPEVGGLYDLETNWLVTFDARASGRADFRTLRANSIALFHEATHQLTFNTGLLSRSAEVPLAVSEGLGTYGETRRPNGRGRVGDLNLERFQVVWNTLNEGGSLLPTERLLTQDTLFDQPATMQLAYAQSWILTHGLLSGERSRQRYQDYLEALKATSDVRGDRLTLVRSTLGEPARLDRSLGQYVGQLAQRVRRRR